MIRVRPPPLPAPTARFFDKLAAVLGPVEFRAWFGDATLAEKDDAWQVQVSTLFKADWIRGRFIQALDQARIAAGLPATPSIVVRSR